MTHTILIVEDEPSLRMSLQDHLQFEGYRVLVAERGDEGLELVHAEHLDLILLDVMLPGLDGFAFCRELKQVKPVIQPTSLILVSIHILTGSNTKVVSLLLIFISNKLLIQGIL